MKFIFGIILAILAYFDYKEEIIPNWIVLSAIGIGLYITHNFHWALTMFLAGVVLMKEELDCPKCDYVGNTMLSFWHGGDVKLMTLLGVFFGWQAMPIFLLTILGIYLYRKQNNYQGVLPVAPFVLLASMPFLFAT